MLRLRSVNGETNEKHTSCTINTASACRTGCTSNLALVCQVCSSSECLGKGRPVHKAAGREPLSMCLRFPFIGEKMREVEAYLHAWSCSRDSNRGIFPERN